VTRTSDVAHTKSISNAANNQAVSWTIGSKPNANSKVWYLRRHARKLICHKAEEDRYEIRKFET
jgi:hypothetical protein